MIPRVIMFLDMAETADGLGKLGHCTFSAIDVNTGNERHHEFLAFLADQLVHGRLILLVTGNVLPRTEILQIGMASNRQTTRGVHLAAVSTAVRRAAFRVVVLGVLAENQKTGTCLDRF